MKFDKNLILKTLNIWNFDVQQIDASKIQHIPMHEWRVSTKDKPLLYVENLQCCVGLYAYGNNFAYAAHINSVVFAKGEYTLDINKRPLYCNRCMDLLKELLNFKGEIVEPFKIGIALGVTPLDDREKSMLLIYYELEEVIKKLHQLGIPVEYLENIYEPNFIIDANNSCLIKPKKILKKVL